MAIQVDQNGLKNNSRPLENDWTKPSAMAIPKEGFFKKEDGRYGQIFPKSPACYGFTIIAKIIPGREPVFYKYSKKLESRSLTWRSQAPVRTASISPALAFLH